MSLILLFHVDAVIWQIKQIEVEVYLPESNVVHPTHSGGVYFQVYWLDFLTFQLICCLFEAIKNGAEYGLRF